MHNNYNKNNYKCFFFPFSCYSWGCSTGTYPVNDSTDLGSVAKVRDSGTKTIKKALKILGRLQLDKLNPGLSESRSQPDLGSG